MCSAITWASSLAAAGSRTRGAVPRPATSRKLRRFRDLLHGWRIRREYSRFDRLLLSAIDDCGYRSNSEERGAANVEKFLAQARDAASAHVARRIHSRSWNWCAKRIRASPTRRRRTPSNTVKIMTVHSAKGLEFPVVFVAAMHKGVDSKLAAVEFSRRYGLGARGSIP